jgi:phosphatidate cytidylyltransferase
MLRTRLLTAAILGPIVLAVVLAGEPWLSLLVAIAAVLAFVELAGLLDAAGYEPPRALTIGGGAALVGAGLLAVNAGTVDSAGATLLAPLDPPGLVVSVLVALVMLLAVAAFRRPDPRRAFVTWAMSSFGMAYLGLLLPAIALVAHLAPVGGTSATPAGMLGLASGSAWAMLLILVVWGYDTGAYLVGRAFGRRRLLERISPAKTVEGLLGGLAVATIGAGVGALLVGLEPWHALLIGPLVGLAAQAGDLAESTLKRAAGRKESGFLVPGHGGILDRIDSFLFAAPVLAAYALLVAGRAA